MAVLKTISSPWSTVLIRRITVLIIYLLVFSVCLHCQSSPSCRCNELLSGWVCSTACKRHSHGFQEVCSSGSTADAQVRALGQCIHTRFSSMWCSALVAAERKSQTGWEAAAGGRAPELVPSVWEQLGEARVWSGSAGRSLSVPALLASNLQAWHDPGKSPAAKQELVISYEEKKTAVPLLLSLPPPCSSGQVLPICNVCLFRGGEREVVWPRCLLFNH